MSVRAHRWALGLWGLAAACGPTTGAEGTGTTGEASTAMTVMTAGSSTAGSTTTPATTASTTGSGPLDTGGSTTGEPEYDLPESCSLVEQDCPAGYKCMPFSDDGGPWNDTRCVPIAEDPNAPGEPCTGTNGEDDCDGASACWDIDPETNEGICQPFCMGTEAEPTCADPCATCVVSGDGIINLCLTPCDPLAQDCPAGEGCYLAGDALVCAPDASVSGTMAGDACDLVSGCPPGLACMSSDVVPGCASQGCCAPYCSLGGVDPCPGQLPGTICTALFPEAGTPGCPIADAGACIML